MVSIVYAFIIEKNIMEKYKCVEYIVSAVKFSVLIDYNIYDQVNEYNQMSLCQENCGWYFQFNKQINVSAVEKEYTKIYDMYKNKNGQIIPYFKGNVGTKNECDGGYVFIPKGDERWIVRVLSDAIEIYVHCGDKNYFVYPLRILRDLAYGVNENNGRIFFHCAGVEIGNKGIMIMGEKGKGKTSLMLKALSLPANIVCNDRCFIYKDSPKLYVTGFPQSVRVGTGTFNASREMSAYYQKESFYRPNTITNAEIFKYQITLREMIEIFKNSYTQECTLDLIIIPEIQINKKQISVFELQEQEKRVLLKDVCFTPYDESFEYSWLITPIEMQKRIQMADSIIEYILKKIPMYKVVYGSDCDSKTIWNEICCRIKESSYESQV